MGHHLEGPELYLFILVAIYLILCLAWTGTGVAGAAGFPNDVFYWLPGILIIIISCFVLFALWFKPKPTKTILLIGLIAYAIVAIWSIWAIVTAQGLGSIFMTGIGAVFLCAIVYFNWKVYKHY